MEEEKKRQSTVQPEQIQGLNFPAEDELNLVDLLKFLVRKRKFILSITSVFTLCSIFYVQSVTPIYLATVSLLNHNERFLPSSILEQIGLERASKVEKETIKPLITFDRFLFNIKSYEFKQEVFVKGGFQKKVSRETGIDTDQSISAMYNWIKVIRDQVNKAAHLELEGSEPKVMLEFLIALAEAAKENVNTEINDIVRSIIKARINNLSTQIEKLTQKITLQKQIEKRERQAEIVRLSEALEMAKRMGMKNNNFAKVEIYMDYKTGEVRESAPLWFKFGELALQQKVKMLRSKNEENPSTKNLSFLSSIEKLKSELKRLQTVDLPPLLKFKVATISKPNYYLVQPYKHWAIVGFGVALGLFISIFMAFIIDLKKS